MKTELRTGLGKFPSNLVCSWQPLQQNGISTAPVPICLVSSGTTENELNQWVKGGGGRNPSLIIELEASPDAPGCFYNKNDISGKVFAWDSSAKGGVYRFYSDMLIRKSSLELNMSKVVNNSVTSESQTNGVGFAGGIVLSKISPQTWHSIVANGNEHLGLSKATPIAVSKKLCAFSEQHPPLGPGILLKQLYTSIEELYSNNVLSPKHVRRLIVDLDNAIINQQNARLSGELADIVRFQRGISGLAAGGELQEQIAKIILDQTTALLNGITDHIKPFIAPYVIPMLPPEHKIWYVNCRHIGPAPDGSPENPFPDIAAALEEAEIQRLGGLTLFVFGGTYSQPLNITRDTSLFAMPHQIPVITETITNTTSSSLSLSGFYLVGTTAPAAIWVNHPDAVTIVRQTVIEDADCFGIYQVGGEVQVETVRISGTNSGPGSIWVGSGALFANGVQVVLTDVRSELNESCGFVFDGPGTFVTGSNVTIRQNRFNRNWSDRLVSAPLYSGTGALEVQNYADAEFDHLTLSDNEIDGVFVHDGASAILTNATIERTRRFTPEGGWRAAQRGGGIGARVRGGGRVEITNFSISRCDLAGIVIGADGQVDLRIGQICGHPIGIAILPETYNLSRLMDRVVYCDNERNLDTEVLSVPDAVPPLP